MASTVFYLALLSLVVIAALAGDKVIRVEPKSSNEVNFLSSLKSRQDLKLDFWKAPHTPDHPVDIHVTDEAYKVLAVVLKEQNIPFQIVIFDVQKMMNDERREVEARGIKVGFSYSSYHPLDEIVREMKNLAKETPMAKVFYVGSSYEGREQLAIKLKGRSSPKKPVFFINCGIHAREWVSPATCIYMIKQIISKYGKDSSVTEMLDKMDFVIMPVLNVDGYAFTWQQPNNPKNRFWRKTRKPNIGTTCIGTDPNRNWNYKWGYPGASDNPCDDDYRGIKPFSEVEVKNVAEYLRKNRPVGYMDIHAYSQLWMTPWGYTERKTSDHKELMRVSKIAVEAIRNAGYGTYYRYGPSSIIIYENSGGSKDYTYGALKIKYSFALELRDRGRYGFLLPANQIVPTARETFEGIKAMAKAMTLNDE